MSGQIEDSSNSGLATEAMHVSNYHPAFYKVDRYYQLPGNQKGEFGRQPGVKS